MAGFQPESSGVGSDYTATVMNALFQCTIRLLEIFVDF